MNPFKAILELLPCTEGWTEEQWAAHDAKIAARREAENPAYQPTARDPSERMLSDGWELRAVKAATIANENVGAIADIKTWNFTERNVLVLSGQVGCGKTVAAAWWARQQTFPVLFVLAPTFAASSRYDRTERERILTAPALVFDDLGSEYLDAKGSFSVDIEELVSRFHGGERPLIITTNCTSQQFRDRYGQRIADRMRECGKWMGLAGASLRGRA